MRKVLIFCIILLLILSAAPFVGVCIASKNLSNRLNISKSTPQNATVTEATKEENAFDSEHIITYAISLCNEDFCDEAVKAALSIAQNNYRYAKDNNNMSLKNYSDEFYEKVKNIYNELDITLKYRGESVYIPTSSLSDGSTDTDDKYPYMTAVASPWDCLSEDFVYDKEYSCGISMYGINYLCENGLSYKEALEWYLPDFEIK